MSSVSLSYLKFGDDSLPKVVILHGLLGSARNWNAVGKALENEYCVYALDVRNHGASPHVDSMDYGEMVEDVVSFIAREVGKSVVLIGHSMGGKIAMLVACRYPRMVERLVVVDIAPKAYESRWENEFSAMVAIPVAEIKSRSEAEKLLEPAVPDWAFRKFLLTNLERKQEGGFRWVVNLELLQSCLPYLFKNSLSVNDCYDGRTQFVCGEKSNFVEKEDFAMIQGYFPNVEIQEVKDSGHNVHFEQQSAFLKLVFFDN